MWFFPPFFSPSSRRLLQVGVYNAELFTNLSLCCFYSQQYDMAISCLQRALQLSPNDETTADVWYNIGHVTLVYILVLIASFSMWEYPPSLSPLGEYPPA